MKLVKYKVEKLIEPDGDITHHVTYESISKHKQSGGYGDGEVTRGTYQECLKMKKVLEDEAKSS